MRRIDHCHFLVSTAALLATSGLALPRWIRVVINDEAGSGQLVTALIEVPWAENASWVGVRTWFSKIFDWILEGQDAREIFLRTSK